MSLEIQCYQLKQLRTSLGKKREATQREFIKLSTEKPSEVIQPSHMQQFLSAIKCGLGFGLGGLFIGAIIGLVVWMVVWLGNAIKVINGTSFLSTLWNILFKDLNIRISILPYIKYCSLGCMGIGILFGLLCGPRSRKAIEENKEKARAIETQIVRNRSKASNYWNEIEMCEKKYAETKQALDKYYSLGFLYPKYRGLIPVSTIYEYLESGRCFSLVGHEGAYNLYESELRMNAIIGKLDDIIDRLDDISSSQRLLAQEIRKSNSQLSRISGTLDNIENNTALTQYYSSVTASNTTFISWLAALSYDEQKRSR